MEVLNERGEVVRLGQPLTQPGGEGTVYEVSNDRSLVAKIYHATPELQKVAKLQHQIRVAKPELLSIGAWPKSVLVDRRDGKTVCGFVMPRIQGKEIHRLYG